TRWRSSPIGWSAARPARTPDGGTMRPWPSLSRLVTGRCAHHSGSSGSEAAHLGGRGEYRRGLPAGGPDLRAAWGWDVWRAAMATRPRSGAFASRGVADRPARLAVGVVSAGRVGSVLGAALAGAGHVLVGVSAVSRSSLRRAEDLLPGVPVLPPDDVVRRGGLVALAVPRAVRAGLVTGRATTQAVRGGPVLGDPRGPRG